MSEKSSNLNIRIAADELALFKRAAKARHMGLSAFIRITALERAEEVLQERLSGEDEASMSDLADDNKWSFSA